MAARGVEDNEEAFQDAQGGFGGIAAPDAQQNQYVKNKEFHELKDMPVENEIEHKKGEKSVGSAPQDPEHFSIIANPEVLGESVSLARKLWEVPAEDEKCEQELDDEVPEMLSSAGNGLREEELENDFTPTGDVRKEEEMGGKVKEEEVVAKNGKRNQMVSLEKQRYSRQMRRRS